MKKTIFGLILIILGIIVGINSLGIANINVFFDGWWTLFIIVPCTIDLFTKNDKVSDFGGIVVGVVLLLACQDIIDFSLVMKLILPFCLIMFGLSIVFKSITNKGINEKIKLSRKTNDNEEKFATFSDTRLDYSDEIFDGCKASAVFGKVFIDLRKAKLESDTVVEVSSIFGAVDILVPSDVDIKVESSSIFGGVSNKVSKRDNSDYTIYIKANCLFGGVEIK